MTISEKDFDRLCDIARQLNDVDECDFDPYEIWDELNDIIQNIED